jgi:hypothetical protein
MIFEKCFQGYDCAPSQSRLEPNLASPAAGMKPRSHCWSQGGEPLPVSSLHCLQPSLRGWISNYQYSALNLETGSYTQNKRIVVSCVVSRGTKEPLTTFDLSHATEDQHKYGQGACRRQPLLIQIPDLSGAFPFTHQTESVGVLQSGLFSLPFLSWSYSLLVSRYV